MSLRDITWAIEEAECPTAHATLVLIIFANFANADGRAYPCAETVAAKSKQNIKTVRAAIDALEDVGLLEDTGRRVGRTGNVKVYRIGREGHPKAGSLKGESVCEADTTPLEAAQARPSEALPKTGGFKVPVSGSKPTHKRVAEPVSGTIPLEDADASSAPKGEKHVGSNSVWTVPSIDALPVTIQAIVEQWPKGAYEAEGAGHEAHIRSRRRRGDPDAGWHARIVQLGAKPIRDAKAGLKFAAPSSTTAAVLTPSAQAAALDRSASMLERMGRHDEAADMRRQAAGGR